MKSIFQNDVLSSHLYFASEYNRIYTQLFKKETKLGEGHLFLLFCLERPRPPCGLLLGPIGGSSITRAGDYGLVDAAGSTWPSTVVHT